MTELPPLPTPEYPAVRLGIGGDKLAYTADQMREYAKQAVEAALGQSLSEMMEAVRKAEREWLLDLVFSYADHLTCDDDFQAALDARR